MTDIFSGDPSNFLPFRLSGTLEHLIRNYRVSLAVCSGLAIRQACFVKKMSTFRQHCCRTWALSYHTPLPAAAFGVFLVARDEEQPWRGYHDLSLPDGCPMDITTFVTSDSDQNDCSSSATNRPETKVYCWFPKSVLVLAGIGLLAAGGTVGGRILECHFLSVATSLTLTRLPAQTCVLVPVFGCD